MRAVGNSFGFLYALRRDVVPDGSSNPHYGKGKEFLYALRRDVVSDRHKGAERNLDILAFLYALGRDVVSDPIPSGKALARANAAILHRSLRRGLRRCRIAAYGARLRRQVACTGDGLRS